MEASYRGELADVIPRHVVESGGRRVDLTALPHRLADATIRATGLAGELRRCFVEFSQGDPAPLARLGPTSLVYGGWDSRASRVPVRRVIGSRIEAHDVVECTGSAQYSGVFGQDELGLSAQEWLKGSNAGFAPSPATGRLGGIRVRGEIVQSATIVLGVLRGYRMGDGREVLAGYLLGLALGGLLIGGRRYDLRSGCDLVPAGSVRWDAVSAEGGRCPVEVDTQAVLAELRELAREWSHVAEVKLGGEPEVHRLDAGRTRRDAGRREGPQGGLGEGGRWRRCGSRLNGRTAAITARSGRRRRGGCTRRWWRVRRWRAVATRRSRRRCGASRRCPRPS